MYDCIDVFSINFMFVQVSGMKRGKWYIRRKNCNGSLSFIVMNLFVLAIVGMLIVIPAAIILIVF